MQSVCWSFRCAGSDQRRPPRAVPVPRLRDRGAGPGEPVLARRVHQPQPGRLVGSRYRGSGGGGAHAFGPARHGPHAGAGRAGLAGPAGDFAVAVPGAGAA
ncbi:hypothetical protein G6F60_015116 [Rhizopus arrhizus]|nr:hypothetical protein G6F60_015116 [Rhizopus arrhizus]